MTTPCNAFPIAPSQESDQLPVEDKVLAWNNLQICKQLLNATTQNKKAPQSLTALKPGKHRLYHTCTFFFSYPGFPQDPKIVNTKCWAEQAT